MRYLLKKTSIIFLLKITRQDYKINLVTLLLQTWSNIIIMTTHLGKI